MDANVSDPGQNHGDPDPLFRDPVLYLYLTWNLSVVSGSGLSLKEKKGNKKEIRLRTWIPSKMLSALV